MALGDACLCRQRSMEGVAGGQLGAPLTLFSTPLDMDEIGRRTGPQAEEAEEPALHTQETRVPYQPYSLYLSDLRHDASEASTTLAPGESGLVLKWRMKDRMKTGCVALVLCLNIGVDPPDVIKISPCARMECWIDPFSMTPQKSLDAIGKNLQVQYERWQPRARYKLQLDPTVDEVKRLSSHCRKSAKNERVLFHYNGHGVPKPTINGEIWFFNKSYTQYIPLSVYDLECWLGTPSIYVFDCSAAGLIVNAFCERPPDWGVGNSSMPAMKDCILLAACAAHEILPQNAELPADVFTSCLTTPIKIALRWFCPRSLLKDVLDPELIDRIPGRQNDRKTPLGELNWIFTAITDTIAWNVLPRDLFQKLFRQDLLVASLFRNFLLAERIMRAANCSPRSCPSLPPTHQHPMWLAVRFQVETLGKCGRHAWDMAAEICLAQLPALLSDPSIEFQPSPFFTEQLTAFEVWLEHGNSKKNPPEQLPIVLQVLLSQSHRFRALVLLGRFLDMGAWAVDLALSVGIFPYVLKLLQTTATELRQILVFIWTKILALDKSCQVDLVKDGGHQYFIKFLDSPDVCAEQQAMAAFVLAVIADGHLRGQTACIQAGLISICLMHIQAAVPREGHSTETQPEPILLQWLCLCLGKLWDGAPEGQAIAHSENAKAILAPLLQEPQPEVRASATYALGTLVKVQSEFASDIPPGGDDDDEDGLSAEREIARSLLRVLCDGSPLVRAELAIALARLAYAHNRLFRSAAAAYLKPPSSNIMSPTFTATRNAGYASSLAFAGASVIDPSTGLRVGLEGTTPPRSMRAVMSSSSLPVAGNLQNSPSPEITYTEEARSLGNGSSTNGMGRSWRLRGEDGGVYVQCVAAVYALARDPSPRVASLGRQILRTVGVEVMVKPLLRANSGPGHQRQLSVPAVPPPPLPSGLVRSTSWVASTSGNLASTFRTPPPSPPQRPNFLTSPMGMRRVSSMEQFSSAASAPRDMSRLPLRISGDIGIATTSPVSRSTSSTALADPAMVAAGLASVSLEATLPPSTLYSWSCGHFSRPLLVPTIDDEDEVLARREARERMADEAIYKCQHSSVTKVSDQIASCDTSSEMGTKAVIFHPFVPLIYIADEKETIRIWNYEDAQTINSFDNHIAPDKGVSKLCLLNELDNSLLLVASSDGSVRVWKDYMEKDKQRLATAWQTVQGHRPGSRGISAVVDWQQSSGFLYASGEISSIMVWDLSRELLLLSIPSRSDSCISAISASHTHSMQFGAGCGDGYVRVFDVRTSEMLVCAVKAHSQRVVGIDFQPGMDSTKMVSASQAGDIKFVDIRNNSSPYQTIDAHKGHLTSLAVHRHAPVIASGSAKQYIKIFSSTTGEPLSMVRYHNSFLGQRIGPVSCLSFHPYNVLLGAGATDSIVSVYAGESHNAR